MYAAIGGVNTHKGTIFTLGLLCAAAKRCESTDPTQICTQVAAMTAGITKLEFVGNEQTVGEKLYAVHGITGTRGQAEAGFPALTEVGLSKLEEGLSRGLTLGEDPFPCQETLEKLDVDFIEKISPPAAVLIYWQPLISYIF